MLEAWRARDPNALQRTLDGLSQQRVRAGEQVVHVVTADGIGPAPMPQLLTHGWPGSVLEHLDVIGPLRERYFAVAHWAEHPVGGHFPAVAEPELLVHTLREVFRPYR